MKAISLGTDPRSLEVASTMVKEGGVVAFPTDTVYGLGCDPFDAAAVVRLIEAKERESKPIPVLCASEEDAAKLVELGPRGLELVRRYWPGALTIVARLRVELPEVLNQGSGWLGVRVPADETALSLARGCGGYITGTSANLSGHPSCRSAQEVANSLGDRIDAIIDGGVRTGSESTVLRVDGESVEVLRRGSVAFEPGIKRESFDR
ncbi:MAG: L-threonylcarbamoyladenylate synthase [Thaumarchaeota archaeon]|nr:L-threonylcarbamoyladenylate synthase [Nitrososphaerota archaeon]